jgi:chorismate mutase / prephenate dehydratase
MTIAETTLDELRLEIDRIDDRLHDLLIDRAALVDRIRERKRSTGAPVIQPAREAAVLRRLAGRHSGAIPLGAVIRIWREIMSAFSLMQRPFAVAVWAPDTKPGAWDLARDHFGSQVPMTAYRTISQVIRAVTEGVATVAVLPMPKQEDADPWWRQLASRDAKAPRVFARLPFLPGGNARAAGEDVLALASGPPAAAEWDRSLVVFETETAFSRARLLASLAAVGFGCDFLAGWARDGISLTLAELGGTVAPDDARFAALGRELGENIHRVLPLGGYAVPLTPAA